MASADSITAQKLTSVVSAEGSYFSFPDFEDFHEVGEAEGKLEKAT